MAANVVALRAYLNRMTKATLSEKVCDACDAVMPDSPGTYASGRLVTPVTPVSAAGLTSPTDVGDGQEASAGGDLDEREAMVLEGGVPPAFARLFAVLQVARPVSVDETRWQQAVDDIGIFLETWGRSAVRLGWTAPEIFGPQFTPKALAWALAGCRVLSLTKAGARLSDGRTFTRSRPERPHEDL